MTGTERTYPTRSEQRPGLAARLRTLVAALLLVVALAFGFNAFQSGESQAYATIYPAGESAQVDDQASGETSGSDASEAEGEETEILDEEGAPLSSGLGGGEPVVGGFGFGPIAIVGMVAVALFFLVLMRRLNTNIKDMSRMFK